MSNPIKAIGTVIALGFVVITGLSTMFGSWYTIDQGERGVVLRNGAITSIADPGLHWKFPIIDDVVKMDLRTNIMAYDNVAAYSADQQPAMMRVSVNYRLDPTAVADVYTTFGQDGVVSRVLAPRSFETLKTVFGQYTAKDAVSKRGNLNSDFQTSLIRELGDSGVIVEGVQIENIDFSDEYEKVVEARMKAEVEVAKTQQEWEKEKVNADIVRTQADAAAYKVKANGEAEAYAIEVRAKALAQNQNLVELMAVEKWNGILPTHQIPSSAMPFINLPNK